MKKVAVIDGVGAHAVVDLYLEDEDGETAGYEPWPSDWPTWVSREFLEEQGYEVISA